MSNHRIHHQSWMAVTAYKLHALIAKSSYLSHKYIYLWSKIARALPDNTFKQQIFNSFQNIAWPELHFNPEQVWVGSPTDLIDLSLVPHLGEFDFEVMFFRYLRYESEVFKILATRLPHYDLIVEIGANVGVFTVFLGKYIQQKNLDCQIYAFEPSRKAFFRLQENLRINRLHNVQVFNCGIAHKTGFMKFYEPEEHLTNGSLIAEFAANFSDRVQANDALFVDANTLSSLLEHGNNILLKIDVEGFEKWILQGMESIILTKKPEIVLEVLPVTETDLNTLGFLQENYQFFSISETGLVEQACFASQSTRDYLLLPKK